MSRKTTFSQICNCLAARRCYNSGQTISEIAKSAKQSPATIRRWLKTTGLNPGVKHA